MVGRFRNIATSAKAVNTESFARRVERDMGPFRTGLSLPPLCDLYNLDRVLLRCDTSFFHVPSYLSRL